MKQELEPLFNPSSLALIGASNNPLKTGGMFLKNFIEQGFKGRLYPVNSTEAEIMGLKAYPSVLNIPGEVDLAIVAIPARAAVEAVKECATKGVKFVVIHSAGFSETGDEGKVLEERVIEDAHRGGTQIVGPNCMGIFSPYARLNTIILSSEFPLEKGNAAFVGQSGWACESFIIGGHNRGLGFSGVISSGNQNDLDTVDYLEYFGADPRTKVIGAYVEGIKEGQKLLQVAAEVSKKKPVIIWKGGRTPAGARAAASHTGALASSALICEGAFKQARIIRAEHLEEIIDFAVAFTCPYLPSGNRVGMIVEAGGGAVAAADTCQSLGLEIPLLPAEIQQELKDYLKQVQATSPAVANPVDLVWPPYGEYFNILARCAEIIAKAVDILFVVTYYPFADESFAQSIKELSERIEKTIFIMPPYATMQSEKFINLYTRKGIPAFPTPERAAKAIWALVQYSRNLDSR